MVEYRCPIGRLSNSWRCRIEEASHDAVTAERLSMAPCDYSLFDHSLDFLSGAVYEHGKESSVGYSDASAFDKRHKITHIYYHYENLMGYIVFVSDPDYNPIRSSTSDIVLSALGVL